MAAGYAIGAQQAVADAHPRKVAFIGHGEVGTTSIPGQAADGDVNQDLEARQAKPRPPLCVACRRRSVTRCSQVVMRGNDGTSWVMMMDDDDGKWARVCRLAVGYRTTVWRTSGDKRVVIDRALSSESEVVPLVYLCPREI